MKKHVYTEHEDKFLREYYPVNSSLWISNQLGLNVQAVYRRAYYLGLKKDPAFLLRQNKQLGKKLSSVDNGHRFKKGHIPVNKGKQMPKHVYEKAQATMFRKGHIPVNHKPVGHERVNKYGYIDIKIAEPNKFVLKHRLIWEQAHGPIPKGYNVQFRDGNRQNCTLDNLYLISRLEQLKSENSMYARYPEEIQLAIKAKGALQRQINKMTRDE